MLNYNNSDVVQCLRQYDMFANSLNLVKSINERDMIIKQLTKLEEKIIALTNDLYEEEYYALANKECGLLEEEKNRITMLIELINQRLSYVEKRCNNHYQLTGESIDVKDVLGNSELDELENKLKIIDKYSKNVKLEKELNDEVKSLTNKISLASEKIDINKSLNVELEATFKKVLGAAIDKLGLYNLVETKDDIEYAYYEIEKSLNLAELNYESAKTSPLNILTDCQNMLRDITEDYVKYKDKISTLELIEIYDRDVDSYTELLDKRKEINEIIKSIKNEELLDLISDMVNKQYSTILMEEQDINTFNDLVLEKERKLEALVEIRDENNSEEFQSVLKTLIENEKKKQEKILEEQRKIEEEEKKKRLEIERKRQEEILKRQKIIEEARKKEMEKRTRQMLEEQQNSILQGKKKEKKVSFETIKDDTLEDKIYEKTELTYDEADNEKDLVIEDKKEPKLNLNSLKSELNTLKEDLSIEKEENITDSEDNSFFKSKIDIEKELFDEFKEREKSKDNNDVSHEDVFEKLEEKISNNKLPDMSIDEYMRNFDDNKVDDISALGEIDDLFPSIPM